MTHLILDLLDLRWTPEAVTHQIEAYRAARYDYERAVANRDWPTRRELQEQMADLADEIIEEAVMRGSWRVETGDATARRDASGGEGAR